MHLHLPPYHLSLNREPFTFTLYRNERPLLATAPHVEPVSEWQFTGHTAQVHFPSATLTLTLSANALSVEWQSKISNHQSLPSHLPLVRPRPTAAPALAAQPGHAGRVAAHHLG
jgi:hypothetical protein